MAGVKSYLEALMQLDSAPLAVDPGQAIFKAGSAGREMFIVRTGSVELRIGETVLETVEQGGIFGELALVDPAPRSATAVAGPDCSVSAVTEPMFHRLVTHVPGLALEMMRILARRLRQVTVAHGAATRALRKAAKPRKKAAPARRTAKRRR